MKSLSRPEFADIEEILKTELEKTIEERTDLGLSVPENYNFMITYYDSQCADAQAIYTSNGALMGINILSSVLPQLEPNNKEKVLNVMGYFDIVRDFFQMQVRILFWHF